MTPISNCMTLMKCILKHENSMALSARKVPEPFAILYYIMLILLQLLKRVLDKNKRVQEAACRYCLELWHIDFLNVLIFNDPFLHFT